VGGGKDAVVAAALGDVLGGQWRVEAVVGPGGDPRRPADGPGGTGGGVGGGRPAPGPRRSFGQEGGGAAPGAPGAPGSAPRGGEQDGTAGSGRALTDESWPDAPLPDDVGHPDPGPSYEGVAAARSAARAAAQTGPRVGGPRDAGRGGWPDAVPGGGRGVNDDVDPLNDADADVDELTGMALLQRELGGQIIEEIDHS